MNMQKIGKGILCAVMCLLCLGVLMGCGKAGSPQSGDSKPAPEPQATAAPEPGSDTGKNTGDQPLQEFCGDEELDAWFASLEENTPVKLEYWIYGEAPFGMEFTDPELILRTAKALQTVTIGGESEEDPDNVSDAGGEGFYFEMEDGSEVGFSFIMGCFRWNQGAYHDVTGYGDLREVSEELEKIGNPEYLYIYAEDNGFYTKYLETYQTEWWDESGLWGGLLIYTGEPGEIPFIGISRLDEEYDDPEAYLNEELPYAVDDEAGDLGCTVKEAGTVQEYEIGRKTMPGVLYTLEIEDGGTAELLVLVLKTKDSLLGEEHLVRFCALYSKEDDSEETVMKALDVAVREFYLKHVYLEEKEVQPGNLLLDFCNDDGLRMWFAKAEKTLPDDVTYTADTWYSVEDPGTIRDLLAALKTVRIGDVSDAHVGGSDRQIFDFYFESGGDSMTFMFFADTFEWDRESYDVVDWGDLKSVAARIVSGITDEPEASLTIEKDGEYTSKEEVAAYIHEFGWLPDNYITKREAEDLGWDSSRGNLWDVAPGKSIGGTRFGNYEGRLPEAKGRKYYECDIDYEGGYRGAARMVFSNDGLIFYTEDHYNTFEQLY